MSAEVKAFPGVIDRTVAIDAQPDAKVIEFCEDLLVRAKAGKIRAIAVAIVKPGRVTSDGWCRAEEVGRDCAHELMASISYLQARYATSSNDRSEPETAEEPGK